MNITVNFDSLEEMKAFAVALIEEGAAEVIKTANQTTPATPVDPAHPTPQPVQPQTVQAHPVPQPVPQTPVQPQPIPQPVPVQPTATQPVSQTPVQPQPTTQTPVQPTPVATSTPQYTLEDLARAAAPIQDAGRGQDLMALLQKYNVVSMTQLDPSTFGAFATDLRALGANI